MDRKKQIALIIAEVLVLLCMIGGVMIHHVTNKKRPAVVRVLTQQGAGGKQRVSASAVDAEEEPDYSMMEMTWTNIALVGLDVRNQAKLDFANSDTMIIASINDVTGDVRLVSVYRDTLLNIDSREGDPVIASMRAADEAARENGGDSSGAEDQVITDPRYVGRYDKANAAYMQGGADRFLRMLENNLDIRMDGYVVVNFSAVAEVVDDLGGIDVWMTKQEVIHMNNYCVETSASTGRAYTPITPDEEAREYHLNGVQAVSYARIRYTAGMDMKRTQRQRVVISKIADLAVRQPLAALRTILTQVLPNCRTSLPLDDLLSYAANLQYYRIEKTTGFPFTHIERHCWPNGVEIDPVVPVTLALNVTELHRFLYDDEAYVPGQLVSCFSEGITEISGLGSADLPAAERNSVIRDSGGEADVVL